MNASSHRNTRFEVGVVQQQANSFIVACVERDVYGSGVKELELGEGDFTESQMARVHDGLRALEEVCASVFDRKAAEHTAQSVQDLVNRGEAAKREAARFETDAEARRVEVAALDAQIAAKRAELYASAEAKV